MPWSFKCNVGVISVQPCEPTVGEGAAVGMIWSDNNDPCVTVYRITSIVGCCVVSCPIDAVITCCALPANVVFNNETHCVQAWIPASAMKGTATAGAGDANQLPESAETAVNLVNYDYMAFDGATAQNAFFQWAIPTGWNESTVTFQYFWTTAGGACGNQVRFGLKGLARSNCCPLCATWGCEVFVVDARGAAANDVFGSPVSGALTIGGTPAEGDLVLFNLQRTPAHGCDTLNCVDARVLGVKLTYTRNAYSD